MFTRHKKKTVATAGASLALVAAMVGVGLTSPSTAAWAASTVPGIEQVQQASPSPSPAPKPGRSGAPDRRPNGAKPDHQAQRQAYIDALAARLGISSQQLQDAMQAERQAAQSGQPAQKPSQLSPQERQARMQAHLDSLAARLGKSSQQLQDAMKQARIDLINKAVADGKLDQERANRMIQAIQSGQGPGGGHGLRPGGPGMIGPGAPQVVATTLGMTPQELRTELQAGKSLAQIAEAKGVSRDTLKAKLLEAHKARIDAAVAAGRMTAEQAQKANERISANIDQMLDRTPGQRPQRQRGATGS